ncbi:hypothetical protein GUITHDRAFT_81647, partial [Guillardia theta CCMP2712]
MYERSDRPDISSVRIPGFKVHAVIGRGGQGSVYLCQREQGSLAMFAVKVCDKPDEREYQNLKTLEQLRHPNIVKVFECLLQPFAIVMEFVEGESLKDLIETSEEGEGRRLTRDVVYEIGSQLLLGLCALHKLSILHRDLKPSNIICTFSGNDIQRVTLIDFGASKHENLDHTMTYTGNYIGTLHYFSPEQCRGDSQLDARVDVWSAGVVIYEMTAGKKPFFSHN